MNEFKGQAISWQIVNGAIELALHREPCNEIGSGTLEELKRSLRLCRSWLAMLMR